MKTATLVCLAPLVATLAIPSFAGAYVRSRTAKSTAIAWPGSCVFIQPAVEGSADLGPEASFQIIQRSIAAWQGAISGCAYLQLHYDAPAEGDAHYDGLNVVKFRTDRWCHPNDDHSNEQCYESAAAGITTIFYVDRPGDPSDGRILDADVELNALDFTFVDLPTDVSARPDTTLADLDNTLTHELGHLLGLDHTCRDAATPATAVDETGQPPPACNMLRQPGVDLAKISDATMFYTAAPGETKKRSVEADDVAGVCEAYPLAEDPDECAPTDLTGGGSGCALLGPQGATGSGAFAAASLLGLLAWALRRGRRQPGH